MTSGGALRGRVGAATIPVDELILIIFATVADCTVPLALHAGIVPLDSRALAHDLAAIPPPCVFLAGVTTAGVILFDVIAHDGPQAEKGERGENGLLVG